jgi:hypothetical protein
VGHSRDLPTDNKLAASPRKKFCNAGASYSLQSESAVGRVTPCAPLWIFQPTACRGLRALPQVAATLSHLEGDGLGASRPDSIIVGRIGPSPSIIVLRDVEGRDELLCSTGVSLFTALGVSATVGFGIGALSISGSRVLVDCEPDRIFNPSAARAPAARISSSVSVAGADFFSRDFDLGGVAVGVSATTG